MQDFSSRDIFFFQGKPVKKCPTGYTVCPELHDPKSQKKRNICITDSHCRTLIQRHQATTKKGRPKEEKTIVEEKRQLEKEREKARERAREIAKSKGIPQETLEKEERQRESRREMIEERSKQAKDVLDMLKRGVLIDFNTGEPISNLTNVSASTLINYFKMMKKKFPVEALNAIPEGSGFKDFLTIITSKQLDGKPAVAAGLIERFMASLGQTLNITDDD